MTGHQIGRPRFITLSEALAFHALWIDEYGGSHGLRDQSLLESALAQPQAGFGDTRVHEYPFGMAAAYAFHIAKNHPFVDGNKRAALGCCAVFLRMNGWNLRSEQEEAADQILKLIDGSLNKETFAAWLKARCTLRPSLELRDFFQAVTYDLLASQAVASAAQASQHEFLATVREAAHAIPVIVDLKTYHDRQVERNEPMVAAMVAAQAILLASLYRIAEDMGYDW